MAGQLAKHVMTKYYHSINENMTNEKFSLSNKPRENNVPKPTLLKVLVFMHEGLWSLGTVQRLGHVTCSKLQRLTSPTVQNCADAGSPWEASNAVPGAALTQTLAASVVRVSTPDQRL